MMTKVLSFLLAAYLMLGMGEAQAEHFAGAEIYWECLTSGQDAGKFKFYVLVYTECSVPTAVSVSHLEALNVPNLWTIPLAIAAGYPQDATPAECGFTCADQVLGISMEKYLFESEPITITGTPPADGYTFYWNPCCRIAADNLVNSVFETTYFAATMYSFNGQDVYPCYDSSPQFAEPPISAQCAGYQVRYNGNAIDTDLDSLSYELTDAIGNNGIPVTYASGFSATQPLPPPSLTSLDPITGHISYDSDLNTAGRYTVVTAVNSWKCGQLVSRSIRDMNFIFTACSEPNNIPQVAPPTWNSPVGATGFDVTVQAGDLVSFTLEGVDTDLINNSLQTIELTAEGVQFSSDFLDPNLGCLNAPCATLTNFTPPMSDAGSISTEFNWQTSCNHLGLNDQCGNLTNTYNFLFKFRDDYCPVSGTNTVNVAVTVVGDPILESPNPHCVDVVDELGNIEILWEPVEDLYMPPSFVAYEIFHSSSPSGPWQNIGTESDINVGSFVHSDANPLIVPDTTSANYYQIRTRTGCNDQVLSAPVQIVSSIFLEVTPSGDSAILNWTSVADPPLPSSNGNGQGLYQVYREYPTGNWQLLGTTVDLTYSDPLVGVLEGVNYRVELADDLTCKSSSNVASYYIDHTSVSNFDNSDLFVGPNPSNGSFLLSVDQPILKGYELYTMSGKLMYQENLDVSVSRWPLTLDLNSGVYLLKAISQKGEYIQKMVVLD